MIILISLFVLFLVCDFFGYLRVLKTLRNLYTRIRELESVLYNHLDE